VDRSKYSFDYFSTLIKKKERGRDGDAIRRNLKARTYTKGRRKIKKRQDYYQHCLPVASSTEEKGTNKTAAEATWNRHKRKKKKQIKGRKVSLPGRKKEDSTYPSPSGCRPVEG